MLYSYLKKQAVKRELKNFARTSGKVALTAVATVLVQNLLKRKTT
jgi:hypothetical protein